MENTDAPFNETQLSDTNLLINMYENRASQESGDANGFVRPRVSVA